MKSVEKRWGEKRSCKRPLERAIWALTIIKRLILLSCVYFADIYIACVVAVVAGRLALLPIRTPFFRRVLKLSHLKQQQVSFMRCWWAYLFLPQASRPKKKSIKQTKVLAYEGESLILCKSRDLEIIINFISFSLAFIIQPLLAVVRPVSVCETRAAAGIMRFSSSSPRSVWETTARKQRLWYAHGGGGELHTAWMRAIKCEILLGILSLGERWDCLFLSVFWLKWNRRWMGTLCAHFNQNNPQLSSLIFFLLIQKTPRYLVHHHHESSIMFFWGFSSFSFALLFSSYSTAVPTV